ncbi:MAG: hypothetical protein BWY44_00307 [Candidatus Omnitrophica bacterium ADurb.Bin292]|nr:MAG: hypothetical protein BWY44_00307 [Candidatus Omnitrophica bacterium ADurb.Bin292]
MRPAAKHLAKSHGRRILQMSSPRLYHIPKFPGFFQKGLFQGRRRLPEFRGNPERGEPERRGDHVVRGLSHVHVVMRMKKPVIAFFLSENFERAIGNDFVHVHVRGDPRPGLKDIGDKFLSEFSRDDLVAGPDDGPSLPRVKPPERHVRLGARLFDRREGPDKIAVEPLPRNRKVLNRANGFDTVISRRGDGLAPQRVFFQTHFHLFHDSASNVVFP